LAKAGVIGIRDSKEYNVTQTTQKKMLPVLGFTLATRIVIIVIAQLFKQNANTF